MAAIDDAWAEARARHPGWGVWISSARPVLGYSPG